MNRKIYKATISGFNITDAFEAVDLFFEKNYLAVSCAEKGRDWIVEVLKDRPFEVGEISSVLRTKKNFSAVTEELKDIDWLRKCFENFRPILVGNFYIYGPHLRENVKPKDKILIEIAAATAFGTGEHPTTSRCLMACQTFFDDRIHKKVLDIGCGSGILSIALAKLGAKNVVACDNDPEAVKITKENIEINKVDHRISVFRNAGTEFSKQKYDFIVANILSEPLRAMSQAIFDSLSNEGILVLSGFVTDDKTVEEKFSSLGLIKIFEYEHANWSAVVFKKSN